jgi:hypothetical protein
MPTARKSEQIQIRVSPAEKAAIDTCSGIWM